MTISTRDASSTGDQRSVVAAHTPGPWTYRDVAGAGLQITAVLPAGFKFDGTARGADGKTAFMIWTIRDSHMVQIADERWVQFSTGSWEEMQKANARLIAAAPDLDAACADAWKALKWIINYDSEDKVLAAAIAKIETARKNAGTFDYDTMRAGIAADIAKALDSRSPDTTSQSDGR